MSSTSDSDTDYITPLTDLRKEELEQKERELQQRAKQSKKSKKIKKKTKSRKTSKKKKKERYSIFVQHVFVYSVFDRSACLSTLTFGFGKEDFLHIILKIEQCINYYFYGSLI